MKVDGHIEAIAPGAAGSASTAANKDISGNDEPVPVSLDINSVDPGGPSLVSLIGEIDASKSNSGENTTVLLCGPVSGDLYALFGDKGSSGADRVMVISVGCRYRRYDRSTAGGFPSLDGEVVR